MTPIPPPGSPGARLVIHYLNEPHFHRSHPDDDMRPACDPKRIRGTLVMHTSVTREGVGPCRLCWPETTEGGNGSPTP